MYEVVKSKDSNKLPVNLADTNFWYLAFDTSEVFIIVYNEDDENFTAINFLEFSMDSVIFENLESILNFYLDDKKEVLAFESINEVFSFLGGWKNINL